MGDLTDKINAQLDDDQPAYPPNINANYLTPDWSIQRTVVIGTGDWVVKFHNDGKVEFNPDLYPAEGSERAWQLLKDHALGSVQGSLDLSGLRIDEDTPDEKDPGFNAGLDAAAAWIQQRLDNYVKENGFYDGTTGVTEFPGNGDEWVAEQDETIEALQSLKIKEQHVCEVCKGYVSEACPKCNGTWNKENPK